MSKNSREWFWLSFVDEDNPPGQRFLGVFIVQGRDFVDATREAWRRGINPGGEVVGGPIELDRLPLLSNEDRNRLLNKEEATRLANTKLS